MEQFLNFILLGFIGPQELLILFIVPFLTVIPMIFYLITLQNTIKAISIENRKMEPAEVWLAIIPLFGLIWHFFIVMRLAGSLKADFETKNIKVDEEYPGKTIGLAYCILNCCMLIPFVNIIAGLGAVVCWIIYWVKIYNYRDLLLQRQFLQG